MVIRLSMALALLAACGTAMAQYVPLVGQKLYFDLDRVWSYNLYERSRWGGGLKYTPTKAVDITAYAAYGVRDEQWKGGAGVAWRLPWSRHEGTVSLSVGRDYFAAASRKMQHSNISDLSGLSSFMSQLMDDRRGFDVGYVFKVYRTTYIIEGKVFEGYELYDEWYRPIYIVDGGEPRRSDGYELSLLMHHPSGFSAQLMNAYRHTWRLLLQYDHRFTLGPFDLYTFAQAGICNNDAPFYYRFDLGGTYGSPLWFRNSMLTLQPYEYVAHRFMFGSTRLKLHEPLFKLWSKMFAVGSNPRPLVGVNGVWGYRYHDDVESGSPEPSDKSMAAIEVVAGIDGLIRWGAVDYGVSFAWKVPLATVETGRLTTLLSAEITL